MRSPSESSFVLKRPRSKIFTTIALAGLLAISLAGCSAATPKAADCTPTKAGASSEKVKVTGKFGESPKVTFSTPLKSTTSERSVVITGTGASVAAGKTVSVHYLAYNATTGKQVDATPYTAAALTPFTLDKASLLTGLYKSLVCSHVGDRVVSVLPPADMFKTAGQSGLGVGATDSLIFVFDVVKLQADAMKKANGAAQPAPEGYPTVKLAANGEPTITVPKTAAPTTLMIADLKKGTGTTVKTGASVTVQYTGVIWATNKVFDSSWTRGTPATFATDQVVTGFGKALVGQKVGSQVIVVIPPADGYGTAGQADAGISGTDTLVFVVDILATT